MLIAKMKMEVAFTLTLPLGDVPKDQAQAEFDKPGAKEQLSQGLLESIKESMGNAGTVELASVDIELVEI